MDGRRFDRWVRAWTAPGSRRALLAWTARLGGGVALAAGGGEAAARKKKHHPPPDTDLCLNPFDPVNCLATGGCEGCVTASGNLCRTNPCVATDLTLSCIATVEGKHFCVREPAGTACGDFPRCKQSKECKSGHVCGHSCCNDGQLRCFPTCSTVGGSRSAGVGRVRDAGRPLPRTRGGGG